MIPIMPWEVFLNHVCLHQTIIGLEAKKQLEYLDEYPDVVFACCGGGIKLCRNSFFRS